MSEFDSVLGSGTVVDVFNILSSVATLVLGFMGFVVSKIMHGKNMREAMELEYARRRELVKEACAGVRMEFAITQSARKSCTASRCPASRQRTRRWPTPASSSRGIGA